MMADFDVRYVPPGVAEVRGSPHRTWREVGLELATLTLTGTTLRLRTRLLSGGDELAVTREVGVPPFVRRVEDIVAEMKVELLTLAGVSL